MARKIATSKQTGGGGYFFEDKVSAWYIAHLLADQYPFKPELGKIKRLDYQVRADGWLFDDLLITLQSRNEEVIKVGISIKSYSQFSSNGPSKELVNDLWDQFLNETSAVFRSEIDYLCIVNSVLPSKLSRDLNILLAAAKSQNSSTFNTRISTKSNGSFSALQKKLYNGFFCPINLAKKHKVTKNQTGKLLSRLILLEFDFEANVSVKENEIINLCKASLKNPDDNSELHLYDRLKSIRSELAPVSGYIDREKLINDLRTRFRLNGYPRHFSDWEKIIKESRFKLDSIQDTIGGKVRLDRTEDLKEFEQTVNLNKLVFLIGQSGYGKSVLVKKYLGERISQEDKFIWLDAQSIESGNLSNYFALHNKLTELLSMFEQPVGYLLIDGIDRILKESKLRVLYEIISMVIKPESPWKIIITCQTEDYGDVLERLYRINILLDPVKYEIKPIGAEQFLQVQKEFPTLIELFKHDYLREILKNLKYLDLLAYNVSVKYVGSRIEFLGESSIIDWIWREGIESLEGVNGDQSSRLLQNFAEKQADTLSISVPTSSFQVSDLTPLPILKKNKIIYEKEDRLFLYHDLFGDWARYKLIRSNKDNLLTYILSKDIFSNLWCKAVRLYGIYLLEKHENASEWITFFNSLNSKEPREKIIQDLLLESIIFSSSVLQYLEILWNILSSNKGEFIKRFLDRFLIKATLPNRVYLRMAKDFKGFTKAELSTYDRDPNYVYWPSIIKFIHTHCSEIIKLTGKKVALISEAWLRKTPIGFPFRKEVADVALMNGQRIFEYKSKGTYIEGDIDKKVFKALLAGVNELPNEIIDLSLKLCKRRSVWNKASSQKTTGENKPKSFKFRDAQQWKDGPFERIDGAFSEVCMNEGALFPIIDNFPEAAKEIVLALLIDPPKNQYYSLDSGTYELDLSNQHHWYPPFYSRGPFSYFLNKQPKIGIEMIVKLVNFATIQWAKIFEAKKQDIPKVTIRFKDESKSYFGNYQVYYWFRDVGSAPHSLVCALMALEKFLMDLIDSKQSTTEHIEFILKNGNSLAFIGMLNSIGKYKPGLFLEILKPLLSNIIFYDWERLLDYGAHDIEGHQMHGSSFFDSNTLKLAQVWNTLSHRKKSILSVAILLMVHNSDMRKFFRNVTDIWKKEFKKLIKQGNDERYIQLIPQLDPKNYSIEKNGSNLQLVYVEPKAITEKLKEVRDDISKQHETFFFPYRCLQAIENNTKYSDSEIESIWKKTQETSMIEVDDPYHHLSLKYQCVFGGCAVMIFNKTIWIDDHPEYLDWIIEQTEKALDNFEGDLDEMTMHEIPTSWASFVAKFLPILWVENLKDKKLRKLLGMTILKSSYDINKILFSSISSRLSWSDPNFIQAQNLLVLWSSGIYKLFKISQINRYICSDPDWQEVHLHFECLIKHDDGHFEFNVKEYSERILNEFINSKISRKLLSWDKLRFVFQLKRRKSWDQEKNTQQKKEAGINTDLICNAYSSIHDMEHDLTKSDYNYLLKFWDQILDQILFEYGEYSKDSLPIDDFPNKFSFWALEHFARIILNISQNDRPARFWEPILKYGKKASYIVSYLLDCYFVLNIDRKDSYSKFFDEWDKMIDFANKAESWKLKIHSRNGDIWESLYTFSSTGPKIWENDYKEFLNIAKPRIVTWLLRNVYNQKIIGRLIYLLRTKSGEVLLSEGIALINAHLIMQTELSKQKVPEGFVFTGFEHEDSLARTSSYLWETYNRTIRKDSKVFSEFKGIVTYLVSNQNPIGLELQDFVIQKD